MAPTMPDRAQIANRVRAARHLRGWTAQELVDQIAYDEHAQPALSIKVLREIEQEKRTASSEELAAIGHACEVPTWFFALPLEELFLDQQASLEVLIGDAVRSELSPVNDRVASVAHQLADLRDDLVRSNVIQPRGSEAVLAAQDAASTRGAQRRPASGSAPRLPGSAGG